MITAAKALGNGFPVSALLLSRRVAGRIKYDDMGTTFGGGPMACAVAEAVDRHDRVGVAARERAPGVDVHPRELRHRTGRPGSRARAFCSA